MALFPDACRPLKMGKDRRPKAQLRDLARAKKDLASGLGWHSPRLPVFSLGETAEPAQICLTPRSQASSGRTPSLPCPPVFCPQSPTSMDIHLCLCPLLLLAHLPPSPPSPHTILCLRLPTRPSLFSGQQQGYRHPPQALF